ncbi:MAG: HAD hydrolase family protein, partial [Clostridia bacterium]|nr:HAD hydrolase family protein [Clostridia bacterium]
ICVGDYENDISMIEVADKGYAVSNAIEPVLKAADYVTVSNTESAIAKIISEI